MIEEEARKKWCPMVRFNTAGDGHVYHNKPPKSKDDSCEANEYSAYCIASDCMMWKSAGGELDDDGEVVSNGDCGLKK